MRGPSNFEVIDRVSGSSGGVYDTLDEAQGCVSFDKLSSWEIWQGDHIVDESDGPRAQRVVRKPWTDKRVMRVVAKIDELNSEVNDLIRDIRESGHPFAAQLADDLSEQCEILACARDVAEETLSDCRREAAR